MADNIVIRVSTEELLAGAEQVNTSLADMKKCFSSIEGAVNRSNGYWQGDAADKHRKIYGEMKEAVEEIIARFGEHVTDLRMMAQLYAEGEQTVEEMSYDLPADVIL